MRGRGWWLRVAAGVEGVVEWVDRLQEATRWREPGWECDWEEAESALGTPLPADYKELCERFGSGYFSSSHFEPDDLTWELRVMSDQGLHALLPFWREGVEYYRKYPDFAEPLYTPFGLYGANGQHGLLKWGSTDRDWNFFWLADAAVDPDAWPVMAKGQLIPDEDWYRYEMTASEFVYRVVTDPGFDFEMAHPGVPPVFRRFDWFGPR